MRDALPRTRLLVPGAMAFAFGLTTGVASAQAPQHQHYEKAPPAEQPSATGELAPRLQNLGAHTFPVTTKS